MRKPRVRIIAVDYDDVRHLYQRSGSGVNGYGETIDEAFEDWSLWLRFVSTTRWIAWHTRWLLGHYFLLPEMKAE